MRKAGKRKIRANEDKHTQKRHISKFSSQTQLAKQTNREPGGTTHTETKTGKKRKIEKQERERGRGRGEESEKDMKEEREP